VSDAVNTALLLQRIEALEQQMAALTSAGGTAQRAGGRPPKPTGLAAATQPGIIAIFWDDAPIADLDYYEVEVADSEAFTGADTFTSTNAQFTYYEGVGGVTYYLRVRTVNRSGQKSEWTAAVETGVGLVDSELLDTEGNIQLSRFVQTSGFSTMQVLNSGQLDETFGFCSVTCDTDDTIVDVKVSVIGALDVSFSSPGQRCNIKLTLLRRSPGGTDAEVWSVQLDFSYTRGGSGTSGDEHYLPFPPFAEQPGEGDWEYRINIELDAGDSGDNDITFTPSDIRIVAVKFN
jgi:hypothetical protein